MLCSYVKKDDLLYIWTETRKYHTKEDEHLQNQKFKVLTSHKAMVVKRPGKMEIYNKELKIRRKAAKKVRVVWAPFSWCVISVRVAGLLVGCVSSKSVISAWQGASFHCVAIAFSFINRVQITDRRHGCR